MDSAGNTLDFMFSAKRDAKTLKDDEAMNMIRKGQLKEAVKDDVMGQFSFISQIFGVVA